MLAPYVSHLVTKFVLCFEISKYGMTLERLKQTKTACCWNWRENA